MYKKIAIAGGTAALIIGVGTTALAETGSSSGSTAGSPAAAASSSSPARSSSPASSSSTGSSAARAGGLVGRLASGKAARRIVHGQVVTRGKDGTFVTHDIATGQVSAVSATSIAVKTADNTTQTFVVNSATKVRMRTSGKGAAATIAQVAVGDSAVVLGTGTGSVTATHIVDVKK